MATKKGDNVTRRQPNQGNLRQAGDSSSVYLAYGIGKMTSVLICYEVDDFIARRRERAMQLIQRSKTDQWCRSLPKPLLDKTSELEDSLRCEEYLRIPCGFGEPRISL